MAHLLLSRPRMSPSLKPEHLQRYKEIARLFFRYGHGDLLRGGGFDEGVEPPADPKPVAERPSADAKPQDEVSLRAQQLAGDLERLGPTFVKVGQFLSTRADLLPPAYLDALARLQDRVEPFPFAEVERIVAEELGVRLSKAFEVFEDLPIAAASLGQVHRAVLRSGMAVAVKVQRPGIRQRILEDLDALGEIAAFLDRHTELGRRQGFEGMLGEFRRTLLQELDYRQEARNLKRLGEILARRPAILVPAPVDDYVTSTVLTMELVQGRTVTSLGPLTRLELDGAPLADELLRAYLQQFLVDGFFHADPHPGNVFLTDDGRIALLDLGMVAQLSPRHQEQMLKLILAISEGRGEDASEVALSIAEPLEDANEGALREHVAEQVVRFSALKLGEVALGRLVFETARVASNAGYRMPRALTLLGKTLLHLDEIGKRLDPDFDFNRAVRRHASEIFRDRIVHGFSPGKLLAGALEIKEFTEKLPGRLNHLIDSVTGNKVRIKVDAIDEVLLMQGLQKIANRITLGLVISALIVGASLLMRIETTFRILGYPGLALVFFVAAALGGFGLIANIVHNDLKIGGTRQRRLQRGSPSEPRG